MRKILFLGYLISPEKQDRYRGISIAGNKMQWNVVKHLSQYNDLQIDLVTITPHAAFPHEKVLWQTANKIELFPQVESHEVKYCNFPIIKQLWQIVSVYQTSKKLLKTNQYDTIFCFNLFPQVGIPMRWLKRKFKVIDTVCLLADLPIDDNTSRIGLSKFFRSMFEKSTWKSMNICERYIVLNRHVIEKYLPGKEYIVVDGGVDEDDLEKYPQSKYAPVEHNVLFCGALTEYNGILNLINAMELLNDTDVVLDIYGGGYLENVVKSAAENNKRIRYHGRMPNDIILKKQREAWLLINPRIIQNQISQVTFPSKTFEYLLSGTPVLSTRLNGYDEEYEEKMLYSANDTSESIANSIRCALLQNSDDLNIIAERAREFVVKQKNWRKQTEKIHKFLRRE